MTETGAELELMSRKYFEGFKTFYITREQSKTSESVMNFLSLCRNGTKIFYKGKTKSAPEEYFPRFDFCFYKMQNIGVIKLFDSGRVFYFNIRKSSYDAFDNESSGVCFSSFCKMFHEP